MAGKLGCTAITFGVAATLMMGVKSVIGLYGIFGLMAGLAAVVETVRHLKGRLTILAVAHQGALIDAADRLYRLADARISAVERQVLAASVSAHARPARPAPMMPTSTDGDRCELAKTRRSGVAA